MANVLSKADSKKAAKERAENESEEELPPLTPMEERRYNRVRLATIWHATLKF